MAWNKESKAARRARVAKQLRDKHGKWIEMGGGVKWFKNGAWHNGTASAFEGNNVVVKMADGSEERINHRQIEPIRAKGSLNAKPAKPAGSVKARKSKDGVAKTTSIKDNDPGKRLTTNAKDLEEGDEVHLVGKDSPRYSISDKDAAGLEDTGFDVNNDDKGEPIRARVVDTSGDRVVVEDSAGKRHEISKNDNVLADDSEVDAALQNADEKGKTLGDVLPDEMRAMPKGTELHAAGGTSFRKDGKDSWQRVNSDGQNVGTPSTSTFLHQNLETKDAEFLSKKEAAAKNGDRKGGEAPKGEDITLDAPKKEAKKEALADEKKSDVGFDGLGLSDKDKAHINSADSAEEAIKRLTESEAGNAYKDARKINSDASKKFVADYRKASKDLADKHGDAKKAEVSTQEEKKPAGTPQAAIEKTAANLAEDIADIKNQKLEKEPEDVALAEAAYDVKNDAGEEFLLTPKRGEENDTFQVDVTDSKGNVVDTLPVEDQKPEEFAQAIKNSIESKSTSGDSAAPTEAPAAPDEKAPEAPSAKDSKKDEAPAGEPGSRENLDKALKDAGFSDTEVKSIAKAAETDETAADKQFFQSEAGQKGNLNPDEKFKAARKALDDYMKANNESVKAAHKSSDQTRQDSADEKARADELDSPEAVARGAKETIDNGKKRDEDRAAKNTDEAKLAELDRKIGVGEKMLSDAKEKENAPLVKRLEENIASLKKQREKFSPIEEAAPQEESSASPASAPGTPFDSPEGGVPILSNKKLEKKTADFLKNGDRFFARVDENGTLRPIMGNDLRATPDGESYAVAGVRKTSSTTSITAKDSKGKLHLFEFGIGNRKGSVVLDTQKNREGMGLTDKSPEAPAAPKEKGTPAPRSTKAPLAQEMIDNLPNGARAYARNTENKSMGYYTKKDGEWLKEKHESDGPVDLPDSAKLYSTPTGDMKFRPFSGETASLKPQDIISVTMPDGSEARAVVDKVDVKNGKVVGRIAGARSSGLEDISTDRIQSVHRLKDDGSFYAPEKDGSKDSKSEETNKEAPTAEDMGEEVAPAEEAAPSLDEPAPGDEDVPAAELEVPAEKDPEEEKLADDFIAEVPQETQDASEGPTPEEITSTVEEALSDIDDDLAEFGGDSSWEDLKERTWPINESEEGSQQYIALGQGSTDDHRFLGRYDAVTNEELETYDMEGRSTDGTGNTDRGSDSGAGNGGDDTGGGELPAGDISDSGSSDSSGENGSGNLEADPAKFDSTVQSLVDQVLADDGLAEGESVDVGDGYSVEYDTNASSIGIYRLRDSDGNALISIKRLNEDRMGEIMRGYRDAHVQLTEGFKSDKNSDGRNVRPTKQMQKLAGIGTYFENDRDRFTKISPIAWGMSKAGDDSHQNMGIMEGHGRWGTSGDFRLGHYADNHRSSKEIDAMSDDELRQNIKNFEDKIHGIIETDGKLGDTQGASRGDKARRDQEAMQRFRYEAYRINDEASDYAQKLWERLRENGAHRDGAVDTGEFNSSPEIPHTNKDASVDDRQWQGIRNEYVGLDHRTIKHNFELRNSDKPSRAAIAWGNKMDKWARSGELANDSTMFRSVLANPDAATEFSPGNVVTDKGVMSLADNLHTAEVYLGNRSVRTAGKIPVMMEIQGRKGEKMTAAGGGSDELVAPRGSKLFISSAEMGDDGVLHVTARLNPSDAEIAEWTNKSSSDKVNAPEVTPAAPAAAPAAAPDAPSAEAKAPKAPAAPYEAKDPDNPLNGEPGFQPYDGSGLKGKPSGKFTQVEGFENGDRVFHGKHGAGTIVKREANGQFARIQFDKDKDTGKVMGISLTKVTKGESAPEAADAPKSPAKTISPRPTTVKAGSTAETGDWKNGERVNHGKHGAGTIKRLEGNGEYARVEFDGAAGTKGIKLTQLGRGDSEPAPSRPEAPTKVKTPKVPKAPLATAPEGSPGQVGGWTLEDKLVHKSKGSGTLKSFGKDGTFGMIEFDDEPGVQRGIRFSGLSKSDTSTPSSIVDPPTAVNGPDGAPVNSGNTDTRTDIPDADTGSPVLDKNDAELYIGAVIVHPQLGRGRVVKIGTGPNADIQVIFDNDPTNKPKSLSGARLKDIAIAPKGASDKTSF